MNTEVEFDEKSLNEFKRMNHKMTADIEANLKLFLTNRWQNARKSPLPTILDFDERSEVRQGKPLSPRQNHFFQNILMVIFNQIQDKWNYWFERNPILRPLYVDRYSMKIFQ